MIHQPTMPKPKLLITGINGLIGRVICKPLERFYDICGLDITPPFSEQVFQADIADYQQVFQVFNAVTPVKHVIHLAAQSNPDTPWSPILRVNIEGTRNVYEAARESRVKRVVFVSSNHVTGAYEGFKPHLRLHFEPEPTRISVRDPVRPDSDYGVSKAFGEVLARYYCARWGLESICLRIGSVLENNNPKTDPRFRRTWLSHRDLIHLVERSLHSNITFGIYYGVSNNKGAFWDISTARIELGYNPQDDASTLTPDK